MRVRDGWAVAVAPIVGALLGCIRMTSFDLPRMLANAEVVLGERAAAGVYWPDPSWGGLDDKWGFALLCGLAYRAGGAVALTVLNVLLGAAAGAVLHSLARRRCGPWSAAGLAVAGVTLLSYRTQLRAEWISALGLAWTLAHADAAVGRDAATSWRRTALLLVAPIPIWAACHVYWFLGPAVLLAVAVGARSGRALLTAAAAFAAGAVSPYGLENLAHPFRIAAQVGSTELTSAVAELRSPLDSLRTGPLTYFHLLAAFAVVAVVAAAVAAARRRQFADALVGALLLAVGLRFDRNLALLGVAVVHAAYALRPSDRRAAAWSGALAAPALAGLAAAIPWTAPEREFGFGWDARAFPFELVGRIEASGERPRLVNDFSTGSFLVWRLGTSFIDGQTHCYPTTHLAEYRRALEGSITVADVDARHPNDGWLLRTSGPHTRVLVVGLFLEGDYAPVDSDDVATLFRPIADPDRADRLWQDWLAGRYLRHARRWFESRDALLDELTDGNPPARDDVVSWRALVVRSPWERDFLDGLRRAYDERGETRQAARIWRLTQRL